MGVSHYYVLVDLPTKKHSSDKAFAQQSRVPVAILLDRIRAPDGKLRKELRVRIQGKDTKIRPDQVVVSRVALAEFDPKLNPNFSVSSAPYILPWPDSMRTYFDKAMIPKLFENTQVRSFSLILIPLTLLAIELNLTAFR